MRKIYKKTGPFLPESGEKGWFFLCTTQSICRCHPPKEQKNEYEKSDGPVTTCRNCGVPLLQSPGRKLKKFLSL
jgi:hypothetical protein